MTSPCPRPISWAAAWCPRRAGARWRTTRSPSSRAGARWRRGLILVDTKYEFGFDKDGNVILADEIHTPDSSRYWFLASYARRVQAGERPESFDKDIVRNWVAARCDPYKEPVPEIPREIILEAARVYASVYEQITGTDFPLPERSQPVLDRIRANLQKYF